MNEYEKLYKNSGRVKNLFYAIGLLILFVSFSTNFWSVTRAVVIESEIRTHQRNNGQLITNQNSEINMRFGGTIHWPNVEYQYELDNQQFVNRSFCICLPLGLTPPALNQEIEIHYLAGVPSIAVIKTGPHFMLPILIALFGLAAHLLQSLLIRFKQA